MNTLEEIKNSIEDENVSWGELLWLQNHVEEVYASGDVTLAQWAGIDEQDWNKRSNTTL